MSRLGCDMDQPAAIARGLAARTQIVLRIFQVRGIFDLSGKSIVSSAIIHRIVRFYFPGKLTVALFSWIWRSP